MKKDVYGFNESRRRPIAAPSVNSMLGLLNGFRRLTTTSRGF